MALSEKEMVVYTALQLLGEDVRELLDAIPTNRVCNITNTMRTPNTAASYVCVVWFITKVMKRHPVALISDANIRAREMKV